MNVELHETYAHLDRANNEIARLQTMIDWVHQEDPDFARPDFCPSSSAGSTPKVLAPAAARPRQAVGAALQTPHQVLHVLVAAGSYAPLPLTPGV